MAVDAARESPPSRRPEPPSFGGELRRRVHPGDVALLVAVPACLLAVYALPRATRTALALAYADPTLVSAYAAHFVHLDAAHLATNLVGYALVVPLTYALCVLSDRRAQFYVAFVTFLTAFPLVLSGLNVLLPRHAVGFGFSGINMAFFGFLPTPLLGFLSARFSGDFDAGHAPLFFFVGSATIALLAVPASPVGALVAALAVVGALAYLRVLLADLADLRLDGLHRAARRAGYFELAAAGVCLFALFPFAAFPADVAGDGRVLNLFSHLLGYCLGFVATYATFRLVDVGPGLSK